jgi:hypothetical protein
MNGKKTGSAGRKNDNKLWDKFNKSADRFFNAKKETIEQEINHANDLLKKLKSEEISIIEASNAIQELKNINKTKEYLSIQQYIKSKKIEQQTKHKEAKVYSYIALLDSFINQDLDNNALPSSIKNKLNKQPLDKSNIEKLRYACIKLESLAQLDSLKKDAELRQSIKMEMLTSKFNKTSNNLNSLDDLIVYFINNLSVKIGTAEKSLWKRVSKSIEILA